MTQDTARMDKAKEHWEGLINAQQHRINQTEDEIVRLVKLKENQIKYMHYLGDCLAKSQNYELQLKP